MANLPLNEPAGVLVKSTCVDFPGILAGSFFLKGCNLRCPYCYNIDLVALSSEEKHQDSNTELSTVEELFSHLEKRQGILKGLVISGGEPLLNPYTPEIIKKAKELGYKIKLDTNGTLPDELEAFINAPELKPDFIAMDIKTSPSRYSTLLCHQNSKHFGDQQYFENQLKRSIKLISDYPADSREFRTVLVPVLVTKDDILEIAKLLPPDASWQFAEFQNKNCLNPAFNEIPPYLDAEVKELVAYAQSFIEKAQLR